MIAERVFIQTEGIYMKAKFLIDNFFSCNHNYILSELRNNIKQDWFLQLGIPNLFLSLMGKNHMTFLTISLLLEGCLSKQSALTAKQHQKLMSERE